MLTWFDNDFSAEMTSMNFPKTIDDDHAVSFWQFLKIKMEERYTCCSVIMYENNIENYRSMPFVQIIFLNKREHALKEAAAVFAATLYEQYSCVLMDKVLRPKATLLDIYHFVTYHSIDRILTANLQQMEKLYPISQRRLIHEIQEHDTCAEEDEKQPKDDFPNIILITELLGCYIDIDTSECRDDLRHLGFPIDDNDKNIVVICPSNIKAFAEKMTDAAATPEEKHLLFDRLLQLTFTHEFGHMVFSYMLAELSKMRHGWRHFRKRQEQQANLFASFVTHGAYDPLIKEKTERQPKAYHDPLLITETPYEEWLDLYTDEAAQVNPFWPV